MTCPRCNGLTTLEQDQYGTYRSCLHCGFLDALDGYDPEAKPPLRGHNQRGLNRKGKLRGMTRAQRRH